MHIYDLVQTEGNPAYQELMISNLYRQYGFLRSLVTASVALNRPMLSQEVIRALNYHAIACLHSSAGRWRPCPVTVGDYTPPPFWEVPGRMDMFVDEVNRFWAETDAVILAAFVLWKLNRIHPFVNGNGRTARVTCFFVLCLKVGGWIDMDVLLPELIKANHDEYVAALKHVDASIVVGPIDLGPLHTMLSRLLDEHTEKGEAA
jgi:Fic family protein